jgi:hypothetical protein
MVPTTLLNNSWNYLYIGKGQRYLSTVINKRNGGERGGCYPAVLEK